MSDFPQTCERCNGSGEIGRKCRGAREAPGPVPDDARGWYAATCPDCKGVGVFIGEEEDEEDDDSHGPKPLPADEARAAHRAFVDAGYASLDGYVERYGRDGE